MNNLEKHKEQEILQMLINAPDTQLDKIIRDRLEKVMNGTVEELKKELRYSIDACAYASLSSGFVISVLHTIHRKVGGKQEDFNNEMCPWRVTEFI